MQEDFILKADPAPLELDQSRIVLIAPGLQGTGTWFSQRASGETRAFDGQLSLIDSAISEADVEERHTLVLDAQTPVVSAGAVRGAGAVADDELLLRVPLNVNEAALILYRDEADIVSFHYREARSAQTSTTATRALDSAGQDEFRIRLRSGTIKPATGKSDVEVRGDIGCLVSKVIKVLIVRLLPNQTGKAVVRRVKAWEDKKRADQGLHGGDADQLLAAAPKPLKSLQALAGKKALLFIHGTTSSTEGAFHELKRFPEFLTRLYAAYDGRILGFNHHTMTKNVAENVRDFYAEFASAPGEYSFDVICHSRGGLVARALAKLSDAEIARFVGEPWQRPPGVKVTIDRIVFVATPNAGTQLAQPERIPDFVERLTNYVNMFPDGVLSIGAGALMSIAAAIVEVGLPRLPGLADQAPDSDLLRALSAAEGNGTADRYFAFRANFEPSGNLVDVVKDAVVDRVFGPIENDLVVPTNGVTSTPTFNLPPAQCIAFGPGDGVHHTNFFKQDKIQEIARFLGVSKYRE
ncbi:MAG: alpha/beta hydrolase [Deltaproteobacteria bacterium]|nr:alpha/beta hydrolase [Deltaproteobacteria bacterium]